MTEIMKNPELENKEKASKPEKPYDPNKGKTKLECVSKTTRINEIKDQLKGKVYENGKKIILFFPDKNCQNHEMVFNLDSQQINYQGKTIKVELPKGASISKVFFDENGITIEGKLGFFTGSGKASYKDLISAIDDVMSKGTASFDSGSGKITLASL